MIIVKEVIKRTENNEKKVNGISFPARLICLKKKKKNKPNIGRYNDNHVNNIHCIYVLKRVISVTRVMQYWYNPLLDNRLQLILCGYAVWPSTRESTQYITRVSRTLSNDDGGRHDGEVGFHLNSTLSFRAKAEITECRRLYNGISRSPSSDGGVLLNSRVIRVEVRLKHLDAYRMYDDIFSRFI